MGLNITIFTQTVDVYVAGENHNCRPVIWKNGEILYSLTNESDGEYPNDAGSIYVLGSDVYAAGRENYQACYWINNEKFPLDNIRSSYACSIFVVESDVGISEVHNEKIKIYPNPTANKIYIEVESHLKLYDLLGNLLMETFSKEIDISMYPQGLYFLRVENKTMKVVKE